MIPAPKGRNLLLVRHYKPSCEDQLQVDQLDNIQCFSQSNRKSSSIGFAESRGADCFRLFGKSERPGKDILPPRRRMLPVAEVEGAFEDSPRFPIVKLRKFIKSKCLSLRKVGKREREEADTYAESESEPGLDGGASRCPDSINSSESGGGASSCTPIVSRSGSNSIGIQLSSESYSESVSEPDSESDSEDDAVLDVDGCDTDDSGPRSDSVDDAGFAVGTCTCVDTWPDSNGAEFEDGCTVDDVPVSSGGYPRSSESPHHLSNLSNSFVNWSNSSPRFPNTVITSFGTCPASTYTFFPSGISAGAAKAKLMMERIRRIRGTVLYRRIVVECVMWGTELLINLYVGFNCLKKRCI